MAANALEWQRAQKIAKDKVGFLMHLSVYATITTFFAALWLLTGGPSTFPWFLFPMTMWGIGLAIHAAAVFFGEGFESKLTQREYERLTGGRGLPP